MRTGLDLEADDLLSGVQVDRFWRWMVLKVWRMQSGKNGEYILGSARQI